MSNVTPQLLKQLSDKVYELRDIDLALTDLQQRISELTEHKRTIETVTLPEMMVDGGVDSVGIPSDGNMPAYDLKLENFYSASIAASWEPERRAAAFKYLEDNDAGDLIKTQIVIAIPREQREEAKKLAKQLSKYSPEVSEAVHSSTLKSWLKEKIQKGDDVKLDVIGGTIGQIVKPKPRKKGK